MTTPQVARTQATYNYTRQTSYPAHRGTPVAAPARVAKPADGAESWYLENDVSNRMVLSMRSGLPSEIGWALTRLGNLAHQWGNRYSLQNMPGSVDALFALADWYIDNAPSNPSLDPFSSDKETWTRRAHALEALLILRNSALEESNMRPILQHPYIVTFIHNALCKLQPAEAHAEFVVYTLDIIQALGPHLVLPPPPSEESVKRQSLHRKKKRKNGKPLVPVARISEIAATSDDRALIISALSALTALFSVPENTPHIESCSQALDAALRYLPLTQDRPLITTSLDYLFAHLSYAPASKAFLMNPHMPEAVKLLVAILRLEQRVELRSQELPPAPVPANPLPATHKDYQLSLDEIQKLIPIAEPARMQTIFVSAPEEEQTQVTLWSLYRDTFTPYSHQYPPLNASDVIRNVTIAVPTAQPMVFPGPPQRFVIRGIGRRQQPVQDRFKCRWDRSACTADVFKNPEELHRHLEEHLNAAGVVPPAQCLWATCAHTDEPARLGTHVLTHVPASQSSESPHANAHPNTVAYPVASAHSPETTSFLLTALLVLRLIWRAAIPATLHAGASVPKADEDHFGFPAPPGLLDRGTEEDEMGGEALEGEKRGVRAFKTVVERLQAGLRLLPKLGAPQSTMQMLSSLHKSLWGILNPAHDPDYERSQGDQPPCEPPASSATTVVTGSQLSQPDSGAVYIRLVRVDGFPGESRKPYEQVGPVYMPQVNATLVSSERPCESTSSPNTCLGPPSAPGYRKCISQSSSMAEKTRETTFSLAPGKFITALRSVE
ncbi:Chromatin structure-remodeling complex protein rsc9 [Ceratobasidium sp. 423]|nr:Chromatin structure-remodeling complex protein rsc9 [Ceratobasidium sp. 423]